MRPKCKCGERLVKAGRQDDIWFTNLNCPSCNRTYLYRSGELREYEYAKIRFNASTRQTVVIDRFIGRVPVE